MSFNIPNTFVAGTKACADEVNENFTSVQDEINKCAQTLTKMQETLDYIQNDMLEDYVSEAEMIAKSQKSKFSINYANLAPDGITPDILNGEDNILSFKVGGEYSVLIITNAFGDSETFEYIENVDISGYADGTYNVFISMNGEVELFATRMFRCPKEPSGIIINDVWLKTIEPWSCFKFNGLSWVDYDSVLIGSVTVSEGNITSVSNNGFNTQYLDSDCIFLTKTGRKNISKRFETEWFNVVEKGTYNFEHNFNIDPLRLKIRLVAKVKEDFANFRAGDIIETAYSNWAGNEANAEIGYILKFNKTSVTLGVGNSPYHCCNDFGSNGYSLLLRSNLEYKIIVTEDVN